MIIGETKGEVPCTMFVCLFLLASESLWKNDIVVGERVKVCLGLNIYAHLSLSKTPKHLKFTVSVVSYSQFASFNSLIALCSPVVWRLICPLRTYKRSLLLLNSLLVIEAPHPGDSTPNTTYFIH